MLKTMNIPTSVGSNTVAKSTHAGSVKRVGTRVSRHIADLRWQIQFTQMKLNSWQEQEDCRWENLVRMQQQAKRKLQAVAC